MMCDLHMRSGTFQLSRPQSSCCYIVYNSLSQPANLHIRRSLGSSSRYDWDYHQGILDSLLALALVAFRWPPSAGSLLGVTAP